MNIIETRHLFHEFKTRGEGGKEQSVHALDGVDLQVEAGRFFAIIGPNGSGKSTLAKHLNALLQPTKGTVLISGMDTADDKKLWDIRRKAGMVFQNPDNQIVSSVVEEEVAFGPENIGLPAEEISSRVDAALESVNMKAYRLKMPSRLSGGEKQRVAIAGILAMEPDCIILDEATAMLDPEGRREVLNAVRTLNREKGITIIFITHHMEEAVGSDTVFVMDHGKAVLAGAPGFVFSHIETLRSIGLEAPQVCELAYLLKSEGVPLSDGIISEERLVDEIEEIYRLRKEPSGDLFCGQV